LVRGRQYPDRPMVGAGALVVRDGRILLVKRRNPPNKGRWAVPGGLVELGESTLDAARREVREELGIEIEVGSLFEVASTVELDKTGRARYHFIIVDYLARPVGGRVRLNLESSRYGWFTAEQVLWLSMAEDTRAVVLKCLKASPEVCGPGAR
jgi:8-oxo-dGTP diphosphatase